MHTSISFPPQCIYMSHLVHHDQRDANCQHALDLTSGTPWWMMHHSPSSQHCGLQPTSHTQQVGVPSLSLFLFSEVNFFCFLCRKLHFLYILNIINYNIDIFLSKSWYRQLNCEIWVDSFKCQFKCLSKIYRQSSNLVRDVTLAAKHLKYRFRSINLLNIWREVQITVA